MKSRTIPLILLLAAIILFLVFFVTRNIFVSSEDVSTRAKVLTPKSSESIAAEAESKERNIKSDAYETFVPLNPGETLISTYVMDINNDGYDDEVIAVRSTSTPYLELVPAIINSESGTYTRLKPIVTNFSSTKTFSYSGMDVIGDHTSVLIYQGVNDNGEYIMEMLRYVENDDKTDKPKNSPIKNVNAIRDNTNRDNIGKMVSIGSFSCDGTIFIQQVERSESYELALSKGESFSVWVYRSDRQSAKSDSSVENQIQQEYKWNPNNECYELAREIKVTANRLAAKELSRIQDGTVETFASFLDGLWYKTSNTDGNIRYMYFDYESKEIILLKSDTEEVYLWEDSKLRHNGMYVTAINADITNLRRRFSVGLVNVDEIYVSLQDYINLLIKENNMWEGNYKKMNLQSSLFKEKKEETPMEEFVKELKKAPFWVSTDMATKISFYDFNYILEENKMTETGIYATIPIGDYKIVQFRSDSGKSELNENYSVKFGLKTITETVKHQAVERIVTDYDTIIFSPVKISSNDCFPVEGRSFTFIRDSGSGIKNHLSINRLMF